LTGLQAKQWVCLFLLAERQAGIVALAQNDQVLQLRFSTVALASPFHLLIGHNQRRAKRSMAGSADTQRSVCTAMQIALEEIAFKANFT
jgi:hypothetical protein